MKLLRLLAATFVLASLVTGHASAQVWDPQGDFLPTYTGPQNPDVDVLRANVRLNATYFEFVGEMAGAIGATPGALYVWGLDRGLGTERFVGGTPSVGQGVRFDSVILMRPDGTGLVNLLNGQPAVNLPAGSIAISGSTIRARVDRSLLPGNGRDYMQYTWNLWPRVGVGNNAQISDFAPDASNAAVVPEPSSLSLIALGGLFLGSLCLRRRRR
jgi:hypothetical protein